MPAPAKSCAAIILAAGASTRLGAPKQLLLLNGESLLRRTVRIALEAGCSPVLAVLGAHAEEMLPELEGLNATAVLNPEWRLGMSTSVQAGLAKLLSLDPSGSRSESPFGSPSAISWAKDALLLVCDQPATTPALLKRLIEAHGQASLPITACRYSETLGVPAVFSSLVFPELLELTGDQGARRVIARSPARVAAVDFPGGASDIDTPEDVQMLGLESR